MEPPLCPLIQAHRFEGAALVVAEVAELDLARKPAYYRGASMAQGGFIRVADGDRRLSPYEVHMMLANRGRPHDDERPVPGVRLEHLDDALVERFLTRLRRRRARAFAGLDAEAALRRAKVLVGGDVSLGGLLALGDYPQEFFPQLMLTFVHYPMSTGPDPVGGARFIDNVAAEGPIPVMVDEALIALRRNMSRRSTVHGVGRVDTWEYPERALREAIVNSLVHRDYSELSHGTQVQIEMYPDRLVIRNPGGLYGSVREANLGEEGTSSARNTTLLKLLEDIPLPGSDHPICENRGSGIPTMLAALREARLRPPRFVDNIATFTVTFPNHTLMGEETVDKSAGATRPDRRRADRRAELLGALDGKELTRAELGALTGLAGRTVSRWINTLLKQGLVEATEKNLRSQNVRYRRTDEITIEEGSQL